MDTNDDSIETTDTEFENRFNMTLQGSLDERRASILQNAQQLVERFTANTTLDESKNATTRDECYFDTNDENTLYDAWLVLREQGWSIDELEPLTTLIEAETIYEAADMEVLHRIGTLGEDEDVVTALSDEELLTE
jgi:hypothetical protein